MSDAYTESLLHQEGETLPEGEVEVTPQSFHRRGRKVVQSRPWQTPEEGVSSAPLFNQPVTLPPWIENNYKTEQWAHRIIAYLKAQGLSNVEIAEKTGYTPVSVGNILRLPWARSLVQEVVQKTGQDAVNTLLVESVRDSVETLLTIRDDQKAAARDRIAASKYLIDRVMGQPGQKVTHFDGNKAELEKLSDAELLALVQQGQQN